MFSQNNLHDRSQLVDVTGHILKISAAAELRGALNPTYLNSGQQNARAINTFCLFALAEALRVNTKSYYQFISSRDKRRDKHFTGRVRVLCV